MAARVIWGVLLAASLPFVAVAQPGREAELRAAITAEPGDLDRYILLAELHRQQGQPERADQVLQEALGVDPTSRIVHELRVRLFAEPFNPWSIGRVALDWLSVDAISPAPVLLTTGYRLRRAARFRGDGTRAAEDEIDLALSDLDAATPANPEHAGLAHTRAQLLRAKAALVSDDPQLQALLAEARDAQTRAELLAKDPRQDLEDIGGLAGVVAAMLRPPPFGPRGAVRAGALVPKPEILKHVPVPRAARKPDRNRRPMTLEIVVDTEGRVVQIHPIDSASAYDEAIAEAVRRWVFEPTRLNGRPVAVILDVGLPR